MVSFRSHLATVAAALTLWLCLTIGAARAQTSALVNAWLQAQTNVHTWSADVQQTRALKSLTKPVTGTGKVWFAEPNRFRWELVSPAPTIAARNGDELLVIYPRLKRAERYRLNAAQAGPWQDALALLEAGFPRSPSQLEHQFQIASESVSNGVAQVVLHPKSAGAKRMMPQMTIAFSTNDFSLRATELQFADGSTMRNDFTNAALNPTIDPALFAPKLDSDFKVIEPLKQK